MSKALFFLSMIGFFYSKQAFAQLEIRVGAAYEKPLGELYWVYKPACGFNVYFANKSYKGEHTIFGAELGYVSFKPQKETFYYLVSEKEYGTVEYGSFDIYQLGLSLRHDFLVRTKMTPYLGAGLGLYYVKSEYVQQDPYIVTDAWSLQFNAALAARAGLSFKFNDKIGMFMESKYHFFAQTGTNNPNGINYNPTLGQFNYYLSFSTGVIYRY